MKTSYLLYPGSPWARPVSQANPKKRKEKRDAEPWHSSFPSKAHIFNPRIKLPRHPNRHKCPISVLAPSIKMTRSSVVMMAKREEELKEIRAKTTEKLTKRLLILKVNSWCFAFRNLHAMSSSPVSFAVCANGYLSFSLSIVFCLLFLAC